ncbi:MAG: hypothetical protein AAF197_05005 [Pseudomonadota bacterium]
MSVWLIDRAGVDISVSLKSSAAEDLLLESMLALNARRVSLSRGVSLRVSGEPGGWHLDDRETAIKRTLKLEGDIIYHLTDRIVFHIANNAKGVHCLHAAAVSHAGGVLIVPANSGAGKSTFTAWLVANGFSYLTDELILLHEDGTLEGVGRPIQIKANGIDAIKHLLNTTDYAQGSLANAIPVSALGGELAQEQDNRLAAFLFPKYKKEEEYTFREMSSAEAGLKLMNNHVNARNLADHGFRTMMELIRTTPRYELYYGGFDTLPTDFADRLRAICAA